MKYLKISEDIDNRRHGYSTIDNTQYLGFKYQHVEDKINEIIDFINNQDKLGSQEKPSKL